MERFRWDGTRSRRRLQGCSLISPRTMRRLPPGMFLRWMVGRLRAGWLAGRSFLTDIGSQNPHPPAKNAGRVGLPLLFHDDSEFAKLLVAYWSGRVHHQVDGTGSLGEGNYFTQAFCARENHHDPV